MKPTIPFRLITAPLLLIALALAGPASAATITWNGGNGSWIDPMKWSPQIVPGAGDTAVISGTGTETIRLDGVQSVGTLVLDNPNAILLIQGSGSTGQALLTVASGFVNEGIIELSSEVSVYEARLTVTSGTLVNAVGGVIRVVEGTGGPRNLFANLDNQGTLEVEQNLALSGNVANNGTIELPDGKTLTVNPATTWTYQGGSITGTGTLSLAYGSTFVLEDDFTPGTFVLNAPNLTVNGPARLLGPVTGEFLIRDWTINAEVVVTGDLRIDGTVNFNSPLSVSPGKTLRLMASGSTGQALLTVASGFVNEGIIELSSEVSVYEARLTVTSGTLVNAVGGVIRVVEGTGGPRNLFANLDNQGTLEVEQNLALSGNVANNGTIELPDGKTLTVNPATTWTYQGGSITGTGTLSLAYGSTFVLEDDFTPGTFVLNAPNLTVNGPARLLGPVTGEFLIRDWTINAEVVVTGDLRIDGTVNFNSPLSVSPGKTLRLMASGSTGQALLTVASGFVNEGIIELSSEVSVYEARLTVTSGTLVNAVGGVIRVVEGTGGPRNLFANLDNQGTLEVEQNLALSGNVANNGTIELPDGKTLTVNPATTWTYQGGSITGTGTLSLAYGSTFVLEDDFTPGTFVLNAPNLTVNGPARLLGPVTGEFLIRDWTINAEVVVTGDLRIDGTVNFNSPLSVSPGKTLRLMASGSTGQALLTVASGFVNEGIIELSSEVSVYEARLTVTSGTLVNAVGGVIRVVEGTGGPRNLFANLDNQGTLEVEQNLALSGNVANNGTIELPDGKTLTVNPATTWTYQGGSITGTGTLSLAYGSTFVLEDDFTPGTFVLNAPNLTVNGPARLLGPVTGEFLIRDWTINAEVVVTGDLRIDGTVNFNSPLSVSPGKTLRLMASGSTGQALLTVASGFVNEGIIELSSEVSVYEARLTVTSGTLVNAVGGVIRVVEGTGGPRNLFANLDNQGTLLVLAGTTLNVNGALLNQDTGILGGGGTFNFASATITNEGTVAPGASPGILTVNGNLPLSAVSRFDVEMDGFTAGTNYDRLVLSGPVSLNGTIRAGLINGFFPKKDDAFTVLTYPSHTGSFTTLDNPLPERIAWEVQYGPTSTQLVVLNTAPTLAVITDQTVNEQTQLLVTASATDQDLPAQTMTYSLDVAPPGMTINPSSGQITWTPTEAQGPGEYAVTVRVVDNGTPALGHTTSFSVTVNEVNVAPQLVLPGAQTVAEQVELVFTINGTDADLPANALTYELVSGPPGATFNAATREFRWTPTEAQGPGSFTATFRVTDHNPDAVNEQQLSAESGVSITVAEVNLRPTLAGIGNQTTAEETLFSLTATATDPDLPANGLTYALDTAPTGMTINPASGAISWTPTEAQGPGLHNVTVRVTDNGTPALAHTTSFSVTVNEVNLPPVLAAVPNAVVHAGTPFTTSLSATDPDLPANTLTYSLVSGPTGATVSLAGQVAWTPPLAAADSVADFTVRVTDNGSPAQANDQSFQVTVTGALAVLSSMRSGHELEITWRAVVGRTYRLVTSETLPATGWSPLPGDVPATGETASKTVTIGTAPGGNYFQIELVGE